METETAVSAAEPEDLTPAPVQGLIEGTGVEDVAVPSTDSEADGTDPDSEPADAQD